MKRNNRLNLTYVCCANMSESNGNLWFVNIIYPAIFKFNLSTRQLELVFMLEYNGTNYKNYSHCYVWKENLFLTPVNTDKGVCVFNLNDRKVENLLISADNNQKGFYYASQQMESLVYMCGRKGISPCLLRLDMETRRIDELPVVNRYLNEYYRGIEFLCWKEFFVDEDEVFIPCLGRASILVIECEADVVEEIKLDIEDTGVFTICRYDGEFYVSTKEGNIYRSKNIRNTGWTYVGKMEGNSSLSICANNRLYFLPKESSFVYYIDSNTLGLRRIEDFVISEDDIDSDMMRSSFYYTGYDKTYMVKMINDDLIVLLCDGKLYSIKDIGMSKIMNFQYGNNEKAYRRMTSNLKMDVLMEHGLTLPTGTDIVKGKNLEFFIAGII